MRAFIDERNSNPLVIFWFVTNQAHPNVLYSYNFIYVSIYMCIWVYLCLYLHLYLCLCIKHSNASNISTWHYLVTNQALWTFKCTNHLQSLSISLYVSAMHPFPIHLYLCTSANMHIIKHEHMKMHKNNMNKGYKNGKMAKEKLSVLWEKQLL